MGTTAAGKQMKVLGQALRIDLQLRQHPAKFRIHPLVLQGLVHPVKLSIPFLARMGIDQIHSRSHAVLSLQVQTRLPAGTLVLLQPTADSLLVDDPILQEVQPDGSLLVLTDHLDFTSLLWTSWLACSNLSLGTSSHPLSLDKGKQEVSSTFPSASEPMTSSSSPSNAGPANSLLTSVPSMHAVFNALIQNDTVKWIVKHFCLHDSEVAQGDPVCQGVSKTRIPFTSANLNLGNGETNLVLNSIVVEPGADLKKKYCRPFYAIVGESLIPQFEKWLSQKVTEEADSPRSSTLVSVPKRNSEEVRGAFNNGKLDVITKRDAFPLPNIANPLSQLFESRIFTTPESNNALHTIPVRHADNKKIAFTSSFDQYQFVLMPSGLTNTSATYSKLVPKTLRHLSSFEVLCELDDTAIHPSHAWAPLRILLKVHATFHAASLQASPRMTQLSVDSSKYLGHEISAQGVQISLEYAVVVRNWPLSDTLKALRMFLRVCVLLLVSH